MSEPEIQEPKENVVPSEAVAASEGSGDEISTESTPSTTQASDGGSGTSSEEVAVKPKSKKIKKPKKKTRGDLIKEFLIINILTVKDICKDLLGAYKSDDRKTRQMAVFFFITVIGVLWLTQYTIKYFDYARHSRVVQMAHLSEKQKDLKEFLKKQALEFRNTLSYADMGSFQVQMTRHTDSGLPVSGVLNVADMDLIVECDKTETCEFLKKNVERVRNEIAQVISVVDYEELLSTDGKKKIKREIAVRLSRLAGNQKIETIHFTRLILN